MTESQWGLVTSAQAPRGVTHMNLTRLTESGDLVRVTHGVYRDAGAPSTEHEELRAAWLAAGPAQACLRAT
ncbi:MAG: type IV toxin-antitoxin system AbiEi family antitoxin domain-containing protein [Tessaracoccus sp.]|nr:type IV toxin-antitoxin system AbiEi family antitoxin domain-containing protein [Tessaracoccus sp.]